MNRLTKKGTNYIDLYVRMARENCKERGRIEYAWADKLQKLEDIEEELGCHLEVVFNALKNGVYMAITKDDRDFKYFSTVEISNEYIYLFNSKHSSICLSAKIKDYKKTWWLSETKEE